MVTETSRLSTYSLKRGLYLQGAPSPMLNGPKIKETCLCGTFDKTSLKSENSFCGSGILNDKNKLLPNNNNNRLSLELNESLTKAVSASDKLLSPSSACTATERHHGEQIWLMFFAQKQLNFVSNCLFAMLLMRTKLFGTFAPRFWMLFACGNVMNWIMNNSFCVFISPCQFWWRHY